MQFIDYNFVSDDVAKNIMESYGYDVPDKDEVVSEDVAAPELPDYVCVVNETTYALCEGVEEVDGQLFIPVMEVKAELHEALAENETTLLESVEMDDTSYTFGDIFEDEKTGEMFIAINEVTTGYKPGQRVPTNAAGDGPPDGSEAPVKKGPPTSQEKYDAAMLAKKNKPNE
tara:strand:+ start:63 stop:578 length:516 start_codon:yes stop_codon:yes gene_type:complete